MILASVNLADGSTDARAVVSDDNERVLGDKAKSLVFAHNLYMGETLAIGANFILALYDANALFPKNAMSFPTGVGVEFQRRFMILAGGDVSGAVISVEVFKRRVGPVRRAAGECIYGGSRTTQSISLSA